MHGRRSAYYIVGEGVCREPGLLSGGHGCPVGGAAGAPAGASFRFGRMFPLPPRRMTAGEWFELSEGLLRLGLCMNDPVKYCKQEPGPLPPLSDIPAGYTYLGQFIAHEITFDNTQDLPMVEVDPQSLRSPSLDLDSLYGGGPGDAESLRLYEEASAPARLKVNTTIPPEGFPDAFKFDNDLPRDEKTGEALVAERRSDENLAVAQTHVAFIKFHNKVVETLKEAGYDGDDLFECARKHVIRHFQWIVLYDYLPRVVDAGVLDCVLSHGRRWFRVKREEDLYMPLEFSAAAFRIGHSMVRQTYDWNIYHSTQLFGGRLVPLAQMFDLTVFNRPADLPPSPWSLPSDWVIDWRRFYQFPDFPTGPNYRPAPTGVNMAARIDTNFDLRLDTMPFNHGDLPPEKRSITVRNLLRGFALGLPTGEEVAEQMGEVPLRPYKVARGPHKEVLSSPAFKGKTPLWYYILKEAELNGGRLGAVGSRIVAETFVGLIENSRYSILDGRKKWYPRYTRRGVPETESAVFEMTDLLDFAGVVNPIGGD